MAVITPGDKDLIRNFRSKIELRFAEYRNRNPRMGLYFTDINKPFIAFGKSSTFPTEIRWRNRHFRYIGQYNTAVDASSQTDAILNS